MTYSIVYRIRGRKVFNNSLGCFGMEPVEAEKDILNNINEIELMECLGLRDKNGVKIHFGDILIDDVNNTLLTPVIEITNAEHTIYFKPLKHLNSCLSIGCKSTYSETLRVLGNIYNNSDLFSALKANSKFINLVISASTENRDSTISITLSRASYN